MCDAENAPDGGARQGSGRRALPKKLRFEVFKRDRFACQYCGAKAPDVILQVDHVLALANGGTDEIMNLVTACPDCNQGKGARRLDDASEVAAQHARLAELEDRREQLEMLLDWRTSLLDVEDREVDLIADFIGRFSERQVNANGRTNIRKWLARLSVDQILAGVTEAFRYYYKPSDDKTLEVDSWETSFLKIPAFANIEKQKKEKPHIGDVLYIQGILRRRCHCPHYKCVSLLEEAIEHGIDLDSVKEVAKCTQSIGHFERDIRAYIGAQRAAGAAS